MTAIDPVLRLQSRLTERDRHLLDWLADHHVLTTPQIDHALFGSPRVTQRRLLDLHRLGLVDRFRPLRPGGGSYPWHHVLGHHGAELIAKLTSYNTHLAKGGPDWPVLFWLPTIRREAGLRSRLHACDGAVSVVTGARGGTTARSRGPTARLWHPLASTGDPRLLSEIASSGSSRPLA